MLFKSFYDAGGKIPTGDGDDGDGQEGLDTKGPARAGSAERERGGKFTASFVIEMDQSPLFESSGVTRRTATRRF